MDIFCEIQLSGYLEHKKEQLRKEILSEEKEHLLNVNETDYLDYLKKKYEIEPLKFYYDKKYIEEQEKLIP